MIPTIKTHIKRTPLYAIVTLINRKGERLVTTMSRDITPSDERIRKLKCRFGHVQYAGS